MVLLNVKSEECIRCNDNDMTIIQNLYNNRSAGSKCIWHGGTDIQ